MLFSALRYRLLPALAVLAVALLPPASVPATPQADEHRFVGVDGEILPLTEEEILDFLRTAEIIERQTISVGINGIDRLVLEKDGTRLRAGFREVDTAEDRARVAGVSYHVFYDSYRFEPVAYRLATALGISNVPPAVDREIRRVRGSVQLWVEDLFPDAGAVRPEKPMEWARQLWTMTFFDALIHNVDRNSGNILIDHRYRLWMIDHTRAFQQKAEPFEIERVGHVSRDVWERFQVLERSDYREIFSGALDAAQLGFFMDRRDRLRDHIETLIAERGEGAVLF